MTLKTIFHSMPNTFRYSTFPAAVAFSSCHKSQALHVVWVFPQAFKISLWNVLKMVNSNVTLQWCVPLTPYPNFIWIEATNVMHHHTCLRLKLCRDDVHLTLEDHKINNSWAVEPFISDMRGKAIQTPRHELRPRAGLSYSVTSLHFFTFETMAWPQLLGQSCNLQCAFFWGIIFLFSNTWPEVLLQRHYQTPHQVI